MRSESMLQLKQSLRALKCAEERLLSSSVNDLNARTETYIKARDEHLEAFLLCEGEMVMEKIEGVGGRDG